VYSSRTNAGDSPEQIKLLVNNISSYMLVVLLHPVSMLPFMAAVLLCVISSTPLHSSQTLRSQRMSVHIDSIHLSSIYMMLFSNSTHRQCAYVGMISVPTVVMYTEIIKKFRGAFEPKHSHFLPTPGAFVDCQQKIIFSVRQHSASDKHLTHCLNPCLHG